MRITIEHDLPQLKAQLASVRKDIADKALPRALNRTMEQARTAMSREIREQFTIPAAKVNEALRVVRASRTAGGGFAWEAALESPSKKGRSLNVISFRARQTRRGVTVQIKRGGGRKQLRSTFIGNAGRTVFTRVDGTTAPGRAKYAGSKHAEKIRAVQTIDVAQMFNTRRINARVVQAILEKFPAILEHEIAFYTDKLGGNA